MSRALVALGCALMGAGCASTVVPERPESRRRDAAIGVNPDGEDPFVRTDARVDADSTDTDPDGGPWVLQDGRGTAEDQRYGSIRVGTYMSAGMLTSYASAEFRTRYRPDDPRCVSTVTGRFGAYTCDESMPSVPDPHPTPLPHAGVLSFAQRATMFTLQPGSDGRYSSWFSASSGDQPLATATAVAVHARGATVPPFDQSVTIPPAFQARVLGAGGDLVRRDQDLVIEWDPPTNTRWVWIYVQQSVTTGGANTRVQLSVEAYPDERRVVFPPSVLRALRPSETDRVTVTAYPYNNVEFRVGDWPITIWAVGPSQPVTMRVQ